MILIKILSLISLLPVVYVIRKFLRKKELNFFDFLLFFHSFYFCIIPLISSSSAFEWWQCEFDPDVVVYVFLYYSVFSLTILFCDIFWTCKYDKKNCVFNITLFFKKHPTVRINKVMQILLLLIAIYAFLVYTAKMSLIAAFSEIQAIDMTYEKSSFVKFFGVIFKFSYGLCVFVFFRNVKLNQRNILLIASLLVFLINSLFLSRREFLTYLLWGWIVFYSSNRVLITRKLLTIVCLIGLFIYMIYFPFYNMVRHASVHFDINSPTSLVDIVEYGFDHYTQDKDEAMNSTEGRSLGLYMAVYNLIKNDKETSMGGLTIAAIDHAMPKVLNSSKGLGTEVELERRMRAYHDSADSVLLLAYGEFSFFGGIYTVLLYLFFYVLYIAILKIFSAIHKITLMPFYVVLILFTVSFNIEGKLDSMFADIPGSLLLGILVLIVCRLRLMRFVF